MWKKLVLGDGGLRQLDARSLALLACYDGTSPFGAWTHYTITVGQWQICNLPPDLRSKAEFMLFTGIQSGPTKAKNHRTYMRHEVHKLLTLNTGIPAYDAAQKQPFKLYARVIATTGDYPGTAFCIVSFCINL